MEPYCFVFMLFVVFWELVNYCFCGFLCLSFVDPLCLLLSFACRFLVVFVVAFLLLCFSAVAASLLFSLFCVFSDSLFCSSAFLLARCSASHFSTLILLVSSCSACLCPTTNSTSTSTSSSTSSLVVLVV